MSATAMHDSRSEGARIVIVGGGFAGLRAAQDLAGAPVRVTIVDRRNFHLFQPLLYQVATGGLSSAEITAPLRSVLAKKQNVSVLQDEVVDFDPRGRRVLLRDGSIPYDALIVAAGARPAYFGQSQWSRYALPLKTVEDAASIRSKVLSAFERAERKPEPGLPPVTIAVVGAGPTGVELAGALGELTRWTLRREFREIDTAKARIVLIDAAMRVLPSFPDSLSRQAHRSLELLGVEVSVGKRLIELDEQRLVLSSDGEEQEVVADLVLWASGVEASPLARRLSRATGAPVDRSGRVLVQPDLSIEGSPEILVAGDMAMVVDAAGRPLPQTAPVAMQQGHHAARVVSARLSGREAPRFKYRDRGQLAVIGRAAAVAEVLGLQFSGYPAWIVWLLVHILYLVGFANRILVLFEWAYSYWSRRRGARLIVDDCDDREALFRPEPARKAAP